MRAFVPNTFTSLNLLCGALGIVFAFSEMLEYAGIMIFVAAIFDFLDGFSARLLGARSAVGKELDSLADVVTFGVLPGIMLFQFIVISQRSYYIPLAERDLAEILLASVAFVVPVFSALRLAIFNVDESQTDSFKGLATPASAIFVASIALVMGFQLPINMYYPPEGEALRFSMAMFYQDAYDYWLLSLVFNSLTHIVISIVLAILLVSPIKMFSLKLKSLRWKENRVVYLFLIFSLLIIFYAFAHYFFIIPGSLTLEYSSFAWIIIAYILISIFRTIFIRNEIQS